MQDNSKGDISRAFISTSLNSQNQLVAITDNPESRVPKRRRNRPTISCLNCKKKKIKCDRGKPACGSCIKFGLKSEDCQYLSHVLTADNPFNQPIPRQTSPSSLSSGTRGGSPTQFSQAPAFDQQQTGNAFLNQPQQAPPFSIQSQTPTSNVNDGLFTNSDFNSQFPPSLPPPFLDPRHSPQLHIANKPLFPSLPSGGTPFLASIQQQQQLQQQQQQQEQQSKLQNQDYVDRIKQLEDQIQVLASHLNSQSANGGTSLNMTGGQTNVPLMFSRGSSSDSESKSILKDLTEALSEPIPDFSRNSYLAMKNSSTSFIGPTCWRTIVAFDDNLMAFFGKSKEAFKTERRSWKSRFQVSATNKRQYLERGLAQSINNYYSDPNAANNGCSPKQLGLLNMVEEYLPPYDYTLKYVENSYDKFNSYNSFIPKRLLTQILQKHVSKDLNGNVKLISTGKKLDFASLAFILAIMKGVGYYDFNQNKTSEKPDPNAKITFFNDSDYEMLSLFAVRLLEEANASSKSTLPSFCTYVLLFMIYTRNKKSYDCGDYKSAMPFAWAVIQQAVSMGFHKKKSELAALVNYKDSGSEERYIEDLSEAEWDVIWTLVQYIDAVSTYNSGLPSLLSGASIQDFYEHTANARIMSVTRSYNLVSGLFTENHDTPLTFFRIEELITKIEVMNLTTTDPLIYLSRSLASLTGTMLPDTYSKLLYKLKLCDMTLFLYVHSFQCLRRFMNNSPQFKQFSESKKSQFRTMNERMTNRCFYYATCLLSLLNHLLVNNYSKPQNVFLASTDLADLFLKVSITMFCRIAELIKARQNDSLQTTTTPTKPTNPATSSTINRNQLFIDDLDMDSLEPLVFRHLRPDMTDSQATRINQMEQLIKETFYDPSALLHYLNAFFFNCSRSVIARDYKFFAVYKYAFLPLNSLYQNGGSLDDFDLAAHIERFKNVDNTWFMR